MARVPSTPNAGSTVRLVSRPLMVKGGRIYNAVPDGQKPSVPNIQPIADPFDPGRTLWMWEDGLITDESGVPVIGPVANEAGEVQYVARDLDGSERVVDKQVYDMVRGDSPDSELPDPVEASDTAKTDIAVPGSVEGPELDMSAPDDPNVEASAPTATVAPQRSKQLNDLRRAIMQVGGDLQNPSLDYEVHQDDINRLATAVGNLTAEEMAAFAADPTLNARMELVFDRSNNQPAVDASMRPGQDDNERADKFLTLEDAPRGNRRGGAQLEARANELGIKQADLPPVLQKRSPPDRSYESRASSDTEKDPGSRAVDENGNPLTVITDQRLARDTPLARLRKLLATIAGYDPEAKRYTRLGIAMDPAERVAAGELDAGLFEDINYDGPQGSGSAAGLPQDRGVQSYAVDPQTGQAVPEVYRSVEAPDSLGAQLQDDVQFLRRAIIDRRMSTGRILSQLRSGLISPSKARQMLNAPRGDMPSLMDEIRDLESRLEWATTNAPQMARDIPADGSLPTGMPTSATPDSSLVAVDPDDMATFPSRRRDSGGRVQFARRAGALDQVLGVERKLTLPQEAIDRNREFALTRRYTDGLAPKLDPGELRNSRNRRVQLVVPGMIGEGGMVASPMEFALLAAERAGMNLNGPVSQPFLDQIVNVYNSVYGDYAPLRPREFAEAIGRIEGPTAQPADNAMSVPDRSVELSLSPEQLDTFRDMLVRARDAVAIDHPGFGAVTWNPQSGSWEIDPAGAADFVVDPSGRVVPTRQAMDSEAIARQAADEQPDDPAALPVPTAKIGGPSARTPKGRRKGAAVKQLVSQRDAAAAGGGDVAGDTPTPPPGIPAGVDGSTPNPPPGFSDMEIDDELEQYYRDWFASTYPTGSPAFPDFDSWWASSGQKVSQDPAARSAAAARLAAQSPVQGTTPGAAPVPPGSPTPAGGATPSPTPAPGPTPAPAAPAGGAAPNVPPGVAGATPGSPPNPAPGPTPQPQGRRRGAPVRQPTPNQKPSPGPQPSGAGGGGGGPPTNPTPPSRIRRLLEAAGYATVGGAVGYVMRPGGPGYSDILARTGGGEPIGPHGGGGPVGFPPGGGGEGFGDPLENDRAFQMARALQLIQAARVPQYQTANNPIGQTYRP